LNWPTLTFSSPIGVDIGHRFIKAVQLHGATITAAACLPRAGGGELQPAEVAQLRQAIAQGPFRGRSVVLGVPAGQLLSGVMELPPRSSGAPIEQLACAELARMHRVEAPTLEMACWDLPAPARGANRTYVLAVACAHAGAEALLDAVEAEGLNVLALDTHATAAARACAGLLSPDVGSGAILDVGWGLARLVLLYRGVIVYERNLERCGIGAWVRQLASDRGIEVPAAERALVEGDPGVAQAPAGGAGGAAFIEDLAGELRVPLSYLSTQYPDANLDRLLLIGGGAAIPGLAPLLSARLELGARVVGMGELGKASPAIAASGGSWLAVAVGLAKYA
jgi:Tfp pilus assembly PilM family ATPase